MHDKLLRKYYFIKSLDTNNIKNQDKDTIIIYRNYSSFKPEINKILKCRNFFKKKGNKFLISNNIKLAIKLNLDGVYLPAFNKKFNHLIYSTKTNFIILGSAHNLKEIRLKERQKVQCIFISSLFKKNKNFLGINRFKIISNYTKKNVVALGGIDKKNIKKLRLISINSFAGISYFS